MLCVLIVEDDAFKLEKLAALVEQQLPHASVAKAADLSTAIEAVNGSSFNLVLLDMALPSHPLISGGGSPLSLPTGGLEVLFELKSIGKEIDCVVITQYPEIELSGRFYSLDEAAEAIERQFKIPVIACIEYSEDSVVWVRKLSKLLGTYEDPNS